MPLLMYQDLRVFTYNRNAWAMVAVPVETSLRAVMIATAKPKWQGLLGVKQQQWQI